jgi:transcription antitermination factor NusG
LEKAHPSWFAVYTKPRQEQIALENLERQDFRCFLPMAINPYQRRSERKLRIEPLFPRYLFLNAIADQQSLGPVRSTTSKAWDRCVPREVWPPWCVSAWNWRGCPRP